MGGRMGEVLDLEWSAVDLQYARVVFRGERDDGERGTKSGDDRIVDLLPRAVVALANLPGKREGRVFRRADGQPYRRTSETAEDHWTGGGQIKRAFSTAVKNAKVGRHITPHICRHTWATWHDCVNRDPYRLRDDGGWHSAVMVERYAKLAPPSMRDEILAFWGLPATESVQPVPMTRLPA